MKRSLRLLLPIALVALLAAACSTSAAGASAGAVGGTLTVKDAWVRAAVAGSDSAAYFTIVNGPSADTLTAASSTVSQETGIHQTSTDASGMTGMQMVSSVAIPVGGTVAFAPGGYHVMLTGLKQTLSVGETVELTLTFQHAGVVKVTAAVRAN